MKLYRRPGEGFVTWLSLDSSAIHESEGLKKVREGFGHKCSFLLCGVRCGGAARQQAQATGPLLAPACLSRAGARAPDPKAKHGPKTCPIRTEKREGIGYLSLAPDSQSLTNFWISELDEAPTTARGLIGFFSANH